MRFVEGRERSGCRLPGDVFHELEFPDDDTAAAAVLTLAALGNVRTKTMRAFTDGETAAITAQLA